MDTKPRNWMLACAVTVGAVVALAQPANATLFCNVKKAKDGFVALRAAPSHRARLVGRMKAGDEVQIDLGEKGKWVEVIWWRGDTRVTENGQGPAAGRGWVNGKYLEDECG